jgi:hypothetical protein
VEAVRSEGFDVGARMHVAWAHLHIYECMQLCWCSCQFAAYLASNWHVGFTICAHSVSTACMQAALQLLIQYLLRIAPCANIKYVQLKNALENIFQRFPDLMVLRDRDRTLHTHYVYIYIYAYAHLLIHIHIIYIISKRSTLYGACFMSLVFASYQEPNVIHMPGMHC